MSSAGVVHGGVPTPGEPILIHGIAVRGPDSLSGPIVRIGPLKKVSFLVGRNNHGKSTLLRASQMFGSGNARDDEYVKRNLGGQQGTLEFSRQTQREVMVRLTEDMVPMRLRTNAWDRVCELAATGGLAITDGSGLLVWVPLVNEDGCRVDEAHLDIHRWAAALGIRPSIPDLIGFLWDDRHRDARSQQLDKRGVPWIHVPAFREIRGQPGTSRDQTGQVETSNGLDKGVGLAAELEKWKSPDKAEFDHQRDEARFARLTELLRDVLEDTKAEIHVPHNSRTIQISTSQSSGQFLDIERLGDGIKQIVMIGASAVRHSQTLLCIEEPEIHLHPGLQRRLIAHLRDYTDNQYLIATHSAAFLDTEGAAIFHVSHDGSATSATPGVLVDDLVRISEVLGYRASDLFQSNYILWVEGPSDRLYWRRWLELIDPDLQEGVHYTAIAYGGSLMAQLDLSSGRTPIGASGFADNETQDVRDAISKYMVDLLKLGRRCTVVADSDKPSAGAPIRLPVQRLMRTAEESTAQVVVLDFARTVENLLPPDVLEKAVRTVHPRAGAQFTAPKDLFEQPFATLPTKPLKVDIAREAVPRLDHYDNILPEHRNYLYAIADRVRDANGIGPRDR